MGKIDFEHYYNWPKTLSYDAFFTLVLGKRDVGKTYGLRYLMVNDYLKKGERFAVLCRHENKKDLIGKDYFKKVSDDGCFGWHDENTPKYAFQYRAGSFLIADASDADDETGQIKGDSYDEIGYICSLTTMDTGKQQTFATPRKIVFDEAIIDRELTPFTRYLKNEYYVLCNTVCTLLREKIGQKTRGRVYMMGNPNDMLNPYFSAFGIRKVPDKGYHWYKNKLVLVHNFEDPYERERQGNSLLSKLLEGTDEHRKMFGGEFTADSNMYVEQKPSNARFWFAFRFNADTFGIWVDDKTRVMYVSSKTPKDTREVICTTLDDYTVDAVLVHKHSRLFKGLKQMLYLKLVRFETAMIRERLYECYRYLGVD